MVSSTCNRKFIVGGNWKANGTRDAVSKLLEGLTAGAAASSPSDVDVVVAPPFLHLSTVVEALASASTSSWAVAAQDVGERGVGAFTGDVPAELLRDAGVSWGIVGHSERRASPRSESDETVAAKAAAALASGLSVVACVGETLEEREAGRAVEVVTRQLKAIVAAVAAAKVVEPSTAAAASGNGSSSSSSSEAASNGHHHDDAHAANGNGDVHTDTDDRWGRRLVVAYEPVWAIGTGRVASPEQAQEMHAAIRAAVADAVSAEAAEALRVQYGGSVNPKNAASLAGCPDVDGFLVGGSSLKAGDFLEIIRLGAEAKKGVANGK